MNKNKFLIILSLCLLPFNSFAKSQEKIFEVVNEALINSSLLSISRNQLQQSINDLKSSRGKMLLPTLTYSREKTQYNHTIEGFQKNYIDKETIALNFTLFNGFRDILSYESANQEKLLKYVAFKEQMNSVIKNTLFNYISLITAKDKMKLSENNLKRMSHERKKAEIQKMGQLISNTEFLRRDVGYMRANSRLMSDVNGYELLKEKFNDNVGRKPKENLKRPEIKKIFIFKTKKQLIDYAKENSPEIVKALINLKKQKNNEYISKSGYLPTITLTGSEYETSNVPYNSGRDVTVNFSWNLFNAGADFYSVKNQSLNYKNATLRYKDTASSVEYEMSKLWREYQDKIRDYKNRKAILVTSKLLYDAETIRNKKGISTVSDYLKANSDYLKANDDVSAAKDAIDFVMIDILIKSGYFNHNLIAAM